MEREKKQYKQYLVCYDNQRQISTVTKEAMEILIREVDVDWIVSGNEQLTDFELEVYKTYLEMVNPEQGIIPKNKDLAQRLNVSRNQISGARSRIAHKLDFKLGW